MKEWKKGGRAMIEGCEETRNYTRRKRGRVEKKLK